MADRPASSNSVGDYFCSPDASFHSRRLALGRPPSQGGPYECPGIRFIVANACHTILFCGRQSRNQSQPEGSWSSALVGESERKAGVFPAVERPDALARLRFV